MVDRLRGTGRLAGPDVLDDARGFTIQYDRHLARVARVAILAASDLTALILSGCLAYVMWALPAKYQPPGLYLELTPLLLLMVAGYAQVGLYPGFGLGPVETLRRLSYVTTFGFLVLAAFYFALKVPHLYSRVTFTLAFVFSLVLVPVGRALVLRLARRCSWWHEPVVVIGTGQRAARAIRTLQLTDHIGYRPAAVLGTDHVRIATEIEQLPVVGGVEDASRVAAMGIRVALLEVDQLQNTATIDRLLQHFRHVILLRDYDDLPVENLQIRNLGALIGLEYTNNLLLHRNQVIKSVLDVVLGSLALILTIPAVACAALAVKLIDGSPMFFLQARAGLDGRPFRVPKIRTMRRDAEQRLEDSLNANPQLRDEWRSRYKLQNDPRLIPLVGQLFRRLSIDELPQLWAVVRGDMSLVGPRPFPDYHTERFSCDFLELRQRVRPGITGLWQITVRSGGGIEEQQAYDTYYIRNWSVWLDIYILCRTISAVVSGRGAF